MRIYSMAGRFGTAVNYAIWGIMCLLHYGCNTPTDNEAGMPAPMTEKYRPQFHFTPEKNWMNDPNGMVYVGGEYHLFYQYYPDSNVWGPMHWGHAISRDLVSWEHLPIALYPDSLGLIFSGSAVVDSANTSGFGTPGKPPLVAIFTNHSMEGEKAGSLSFQTQGVAFSLDKGRTWTKYDGNPVVKNPGIRDFRDPKVFWHSASRKWIMILAVKDHVELYGSSNLKDWSFLSKFGETKGAHGGVWECPDLFELELNASGEKKWVMLVSINPGAPNGGSGTQYFTGNFDGKEFKEDESAIRWVDYGKDNYAGVTWNNVPSADGRRLFIGWMSNWEYATVVPTYVWRSANTIVRELFLTKTDSGLRLASKPVRELESLRTDSLRTFVDVLNSTDTIGTEISLHGGALEFSFTVDRDNDQGTFEMEFSNTPEERLVIGLDAQTNRLYVDRSAAGVVDFSAAFPGVHWGPRSSLAREISFTLFMDASSIEIFVDGGTLVMTELIFPTESFDKLRFRSPTTGVTVKEMKIVELRSIWNKEESD